MAIHQEQIVEMSEGFSKGINSGAMNLILDTLQRYQYQYPIKSTIREVVSNGLDSIREKQVALSILSGESRVEDHYLSRDGEVYADSGFDPAYYDPQWLSDDDNVEVVYEDGGEVQKDSVSIIDHGVGLGGKRLEGFFNLGFSSKRLNKFALGKFGLGAKSPLSTGVPFYTITTRHNGKEFVFNIYGHKVESVIPRYDLEAMVENPSYTFTNGYKCYYRNTNEKNGLIVNLQTKKHHKQQYLDAVTSQLLYFKNVKCFVRDTDLGLTEIPVQADIMYEDDLIVLSNNSPYSKPHLLLNGVNYGYVDFKELELEEKLGNIGIKVQPEKVSVNPSRESLIWDDTTRQVVVDKFNEVVGIAEQTINRELKETDFLKWMRVCATASASSQWFETSSGNSVIGRLSKIVDMSKIELSYPLNPKVRYNSWLLDGLKVSVVSMKSERVGSKIKKKVEYSSKVRGGLSDGLPILLQKGETSNRTNKYLCTTVYPQGFILLKLQFIPEAGRKVTPEDITQDNLILEAMSEYRKVDRSRAKQRIADLHNYILDSKDQTWYDDVEVPADFKASNAEEEEEEDVATTEEVRQSAEARRKLEGKTIIHTPRIPYSVPKRGNIYDLQRVEFSTHLVDTWSNPEIYWSNQDFRPLLDLAAQISRPYNSVTYHDKYVDHRLYVEWKHKGYVAVREMDFCRCDWVRDDSPLRLLMVSQQNSKYYKDFKHITRFFKEIKAKTITMSNALIRWNTARLMQEKLEDLQFLNGFAPINQEKHQAFKRLKSYVGNHWRSLDISDYERDAETEGDTKELINHLDKVGQFQLFVRSNPDDKETIAQMAVELFNPQSGVEIEHGCAIDTEIYDLYTELLDWAQPVKVLLNIVKPLASGDPLTDEQEEAIRHYFQYRNCPL